MYCYVKGTLEYMLAAAQTCKLLLSFLFPGPACTLLVQVPLMSFEFSCYSFGVWMNSDIGMRVIFVRSVLFSSFLIYIYTLQICVCTHSKGCAGCLVFFFFFLYNVEFSGGWKASRVWLFAHCFAFLFFFAATLIVDHAFYLGKDTNNIPLSLRLCQPVNIGRK